MKAQQSHTSLHISQSPGHSIDGLTPPSQPCSSQSSYQSSAYVLPTRTLSTLCNVWFDKFHRWFPILHHLSLLNVLEDQGQNLELSPLYVVLKAIAAVTLPSTPCPDTLKQYERQELSYAYCQDITMHSMDNLSLPSLQAVLIITVNELGAGKMSKFWNLVALCKRYI